MWYKDDVMGSVNSTTKGTKCGVTGEESLFEEFFSHMVGLWVCMWGLVLVELIEVKTLPTMGGTIPWLWVLDCGNMEKVGHAVGMCVFTPLLLSTVDAM